MLCCAPAHVRQSSTSDATQKLVAGRWLRSPLLLVVPTASPASVPCSSTRPLLTLLRLSGLLTLLVACSPPNPALSSAWLVAPRSRSRLLRFVPASSITPSHVPGTTVRWFGSNANESLNWFAVAGAWSARCCGVGQSGTGGEGGSANDLVHVARALKADTAQWLGHATSLQVLTWRRCEHASPTCSAGCVMLLARPVVPVPQVVQHSLPEHWVLPWLKRGCAWSACSFASLSCPAHKPCKWVARCAGLA